jgi:hypothetical protein
MATRKPKTNGGAVRRKPGSAKTGSRVTGQVFPTIEQIRLRAYELYLSRGATHGNEVEDWLNAERELMEPVNLRSR